MNWFDMYFTMTNVMFITEKDACSPKPCKHGGKCNVPEGGNVTVGGSNYTCDCTSGYSGLTCEEGPCAGHSCSNHGKCKADKDDQTKPLCKCDDGFSGDKCQNAGTANAIYLSSFLATLLAAHIIRMTLT
ncbi:adhesive plaque matrix protein 2-like [Haliotis rubra]|uniref:adhesive plaque matrix protein 2-like n=1 Tax=Haliotis rubra TaxID=36100 RepID=UPI001EE615C5|nr:adhesive plaque matrix protein 2-like [Haliotis rubra]